MRYLMSGLRWFADRCGAGQKRLQSWIFKIHPDFQNDIVIPQFGWDDYKAEKKPWHLIIAISLLAIVITCVKLIFFIPGMQYSILYALATFFSFLVRLLFPHFRDTSFLWMELFIILLLLARKRIPTVIGAFGNYFLGILYIPFMNSNSTGSSFLNLPYFAMREEVWFRQHSESWNLWKRVRSCVSFGLVHITMMIVPIGVAITLCLGGAVFMIVYLCTYHRTHSDDASVKVSAALRASATLHTMYNRVVFFAAFLSTLFIIPVLILSFFVHFPFIDWFLKLFS